MTNYSSCFKIFFVCIFLNGCTECKTNWTYPKIKYYFLQNVSLSPNQKSYKKHDTIKIVFIASGKLLFDTLSKTEVKTDSIFLPFQCSIINQNVGQPAAQDGYFDFVDSNGQRLAFDTLYSYISHGVSISTGINCSNNADYLLKIGIILKDTGVYIMGLSGGSVYPCSNANMPVDSFSYINYYFNLTDFNGDIYNSIPQNLRRPGTADFGTKQLFAFRVTE